MAKVSKDLTDMKFTKDKVDYKVFLKISETVYVVAVQRDKFCRFVTFTEEQILKMAGIK